MQSSEVLLQISGNPTWSGRWESNCISYFYVSQNQGVTGRSESQPVPFAAKFQSHVSVDSRFHLGRLRIDKKDPTHGAVAA